MNKIDNIQTEKNTGLKFIIKEIPCDCMCHKMDDVTHIVACCDNGIIKRKIYLEEL